MKLPEDLAEKVTTIFDKIEDMEGILDTYMESMDEDNSDEEADHIWMAAEAGAACAEAATKLKDLLEDGQ